MPPQPNTVFWEDLICYNKKTDQTIRRDAIVSFTIIIFHVKSGQGNNKIKYVIIGALAFHIFPNALHR